MEIENIPEIYIGDDKTPHLFLHDFKMTQNVVKAKVNLSMNMFSFLRVGKKQVHFSEDAITVDKEQSLLIKKGNCLWTELLETSGVYYCKLLFFSEEFLNRFLEKNVSSNDLIKEDEKPYFTIENDDYIENYIKSLEVINESITSFSNTLLEVKFEELMLYLLNKYGDSFKKYLHSLISNKESTFRNVIEENKYYNLKLEEIAFLCNMSLSTFKRHFINEYKEPPGKWLKSKRLYNAKEILEKGEKKPSEIYMNYGYNDLSNFSIAFKNEFGYSPKDSEIRN